MWKKFDYARRHAIALLAIGWAIGCNAAPSTRAPGSMGFQLPFVSSTAQAAPTLAPAPIATPTGAATQPASAVAPNTTEPPALIGTRLHSNDNETATQKAIELTRKLSEAEADRKRLTAQVDELQASGKDKDQALDLARTEVQAARTQMARAREELEHWKQEIALLRDKVRGADEENLQTLQTAVALLQQILSQAAEQDKRNAAAASQNSTE